MLKVGDKVVFHKKKKITSHTTYPAYIYEGALGIILDISHINDRALLRMDKGLLAVTSSKIENEYFRAELYHPYINMIKDILEITC